MKNTEIKIIASEDECVVDDECNFAISAKLPYSTKQFKNCVYSDKGKVHSHHLPFFRKDSDKDNCKSIYSSFEEKNFIYLTHKEVKGLNVNLLDFKNSNSIKYQRRKSQFRTTLRSVSEMRKKSSRDILKEMLL